MGRKSKEYNTHHIFVAEDVLCITQTTLTSKRDWAPVGRQGSEENEVAACESGKSKEMQKKPSHKLRYGQPVRAHHAQNRH